MPEQSPDYVVSGKIKDAVLGYLLSRPMQEVEIGVHALRSLRTLDEHLAQRSSTPIRAESKVGRNDPCPCGSGKKYKICCLTNGKNRLDAGEPASERLTELAQE